MSEPRVRDYEKSDYFMLSAWWKGHGVTAVPEFFLEPTGVVAMIDEVSMAAGWLYLAEGTKLGWLAWLVTNPQGSPRQAEQALRTVLGGVEAIAKAHGRTCLFAEAPRPSLEEWYVKQGFVVNHPTVHLFKALA